MRRINGVLITTEGPKAFRVSLNNLEGIHTLAKVSGFTKLADTCIQHIRNRANGNSSEARTMLASFKASLTDAILHSIAKDSHESTVQWEEREFIPDAEQIVKRNEYGELESFESVEGDPISWIAIGPVVESFDAGDVDEWR